MNYVTLPTYPQICIAPQTFCSFTSRYYNAKNTTRIICSVSQTYFLADQVIVWFVTRSSVSGSSPPRCGASSENKVEGKNFSITNSATIRRMMHYYIYYLFLIKLFQKKKKRTEGLFISTYLLLFFLRFAVDVSRYFSIICKAIT